MIDPETTKPGTRVFHPSSTIVDELVSWAFDEVGCDCFFLKKQPAVRRFDMEQWVVWPQSPFDRKANGKDACIQPTPETTEHSKEVLPRLLERIEARRRKGLEEYGTPLKTFNGRKSMYDALDEALDLAMYLQQEIMEREKIVGLLTGDYVSCLWDEK